MNEHARKLFVVEYSIRNDATRVRSVDSMLKNNIRDIVKNSIGDYVPVALLATRSEAEMFAVEFRYHLEDQGLTDSRDWAHISEAARSFLNTLDSELQKSRK